MDVRTVTDGPGVAEAVDRARAAGRVALDVEFLWERTYAPQPCLVQIGDGVDIWLVDPIAGAPLAAVAALVADPTVTKVMHAPSADLTLFALHFETVATSIYDTQVAAGFVGLGGGASLGALLERGLGIHLAKAESYSDWSRRPLSAAQLDYAADDVRHLLALADALDEQASERGRGEWVAEELARRYGQGARFAPDPDESWRRVKGQGRLNGAERAALQALAAWRERSARQRDRPLQWVLPDRALIELARRRPKDAAALARLRGIPDQMPRGDREALLDLIAASRTATPPSANGNGIPPELRDRVDVLATLASALLAARADGAAIAGSLVASRDELSQFIAATILGAPESGPLGTGWRHELAGEAVARLALGGISLAAIDSPPWVLEVPSPASG